MPRTDIVLSEGTDIDPKMIIWYQRRTSLDISLHCSTNCWAKDRQMPERTFLKNEHLHKLLANFSRQTVRAQQPMLKQRNTNAKQMTSLKENIPSEQFEHEIVILEQDTRLARTSGTIKDLVWGPIEVQCFIKSNRLYNISSKKLAKRTNPSVQPYRRIFLKKHCCLSSQTNQDLVVQHFREKRGYTRAQIYKVRNVVGHSSSVQENTTKEQSRARGTQMSKIEERRQRRKHGADPNTNKSSSFLRSQNQVPNTTKRNLFMSQGNVTAGIVAV